MAESQKLVTNIRTVDKQCRISTNGGIVTTNKMATLKGYGDVWFHEKAITNLLSLSNIKERFRFTYDSINGDSFDVFTMDGIRHFKALDTGLYALSVGDKKTE